MKKRELTIVGLLLLDIVAVLVSAALGMVLVTTFVHTSLGFGAAALVAGACRLVTLVFDMWGRDRG